ncbi:MAG: alpha/beta fold hydrolase [Myxococcota bacterium]
MARSGALGKKAELASAVRVSLVLGVLLLAAACQTPVGVKRVDARHVHRTLTASVLTTGEPSAPAAQELHRSNLFEQFQQEPESALAELHDRYLDEPLLRRLFALSELSFVYANRGGGQPYYLASAVYAYAFLFPGRGAETPDPLDPRLRLAADLYNRGLTKGLASQDGEVVELSARTLPLPFGELELASDQASFVWVNHRLEHFVPVAELEVRGLRSRYRVPGIGAPLAAKVGPRDDARVEQVYERWLPPRQRIPCTAFVRFEDVRRSIARGRVLGSVKLYVAGVDRAVKVDGREIPLEFEPTAAMAYSLTRSRIWDMELSGFRGQQIEIGAKGNLVMLWPHRRGRIPLVLVHGTASSPARWAEMVNELRADPRLRAHYEVWVFFYNTGNPILYSAMQLREELQQAVQLLDPKARDPGLRRMVVMGHSQGGLIAKLMAVDSGDRFWRNVSDKPISELDLDPESEALFTAALFFEAVPQVRRLIFVATPHGGSFLAGRRLGSIASGLVKMPINIARAGADLFENDPEQHALRKLERVPSSVENMTPGNPFLVALEELPIEDGVTAHSIIAVRAEGPPFNQHDGVVAFESAQIEGVASERVVISSHSVQGHPDAIAEVRRILLEHLDAR